jgi:hypothetical protein
MEEDAALVAGAVCAEEEAPCDNDEEQLDPMPHYGNVSLCQVAPGIQQVVHHLTNERRLLTPKGRWTLDFDEDGYGALEYHPRPGDLDAPVIILEDFFKYGLFSGPDKSLHILSTCGKTAGQQLDLTTFRDKFKESALSFSYGHTKKNVELIMPSFSWPRNGARLFINLKCLYKALGLDQFSGESWRWVFAGRARWKARLDALGLEEHFQKSCHVGSKEEVELAEAETEKNDPFWSSPGQLPGTAVSLAGLLYLTGQWAWRSCKGGGMKDPDHKRAAADLCKRLWSFIWHKDAFTMDIALSPEWVGRWPAPDAIPRHDLMRLSVSPAGVVSGLSVWKEKAESPHASRFQRNSWKIATEAGLHNGVVTFPCFFEFLVGQSAAASILAQVAWHGGMALQAKITNSMRGKAARGDEPWRARFIELEDLWGLGRRVGNHLLKYVISARPLCAEQQIWHCCTDGAAIGNWDTASTLFTLPDNRGIVAPPVVLFWWMLHRVEKSFRDCILLSNVFLLSDGESSHR